MNFQKPFLFAVLLVAAPMTSGWMPLEAQTILLPTQSISGVNTVVSVPDGGWARMGDVNRYSAGSISRGIPGLPINPFTNNRAFGSETGAGQFTVHVQILNLDELEAQHMAGYEASPPVVSQTVPVAPPPAIRRKAEFISRHLGGRSGGFKRR